MERRLNPVYRPLNAPLTLMGAERKLFFFALTMGAAVFNLLHTFFGGILMFSLLYWFARLADSKELCDHGRSVPLVAQPYIRIQESYLIHPLRHIYFSDRVHTPSQVTRPAPAQSLPVCPSRKLP